MRRSSPLAAVTAAVVLGMLASCNSGTSGSKAPTYDVKAGNSACELEQQRVPAGDAVFKVENTGSDVTEVYVYGKSGSQFTKIVGEVENIGPGTTRDFTVSLSPGEYEVACKPGMVGDGIRSRLTVTGDAGAAGAVTPTADSAVEYDRELELTVAASGRIDFPAGLTASVGDKIEFKLRNDSDQERYLEVVAPGGAQVGVTAAAAGAAAEFIVQMSSTGDYTVSVYPDGGRASARSVALTVASRGQVQPTGGGTSNTSPAQSGSTQTPTATAAEQDSPPQRARQALVPAEQLPGFNPQWTWDRTAPVRGLPSPCMLSRLVSIGAVKEAGQTYSSGWESSTDSAVQLTGVFPDEQTALTAASVLTSWHDKCAASAAAAGLRHVKVSQLRDVVTPVGTGKQWMLTYRPVPGQPNASGFVSQGFVRDADTITWLAYQNAGQDYNYEVGHEPIDNGLAAAGRLLLSTR